MISGKAVPSRGCFVSTTMYHARKSIAWRITLKRPWNLWWNNTRNSYLQSTNLMLVRYNKSMICYVVRTVTALFALSTTVTKQIKELCFGGYIQKGRLRRGNTFSWSKVAICVNFHTQYISNTIDIMCSGHLPMAIGDCQEKFDGRNTIIWQIFMWLIRHSIN